MTELLKRPSAFTPLLISAAFLAYFIVAAARGMLAPHADEGAPAHLFQLLMPLQLSIVGFFALSWLPKKPAAALRVLTLQVGAGLAVLAVVFFRHL